jgi:hypothetical protein
MIFFWKKKNFKIYMNFYPESWTKELKNEIHLFGPAKTTRLMI